MASFTTGKFPNLQQLEIYFSISDSSQLSPNWLLQFFRSSIENGGKFTNNQKVQIGWMITKLLDKHNGRLEVCEPAFGAMPIEWKQGIDNTLRHLVVQNSICEEIGCEPDYPSILQSGVISPGFLSSRDFIMSRDNPSGSDSGWVFSTLNYKDEEAHLRSLFEVATSRMDIVPYLALPSGSKIYRQGDAIQINFSERQISSSNSNLLLSLLTSSIFARCMVPG